MRISNVVRLIENKVMAAAPVVKAKAQEARNAAQFYAVREAHAIKYAVATYRAYKSHL